MLDRARWRPDRRQHHGRDTTLPESVGNQFPAVARRKFGDHNRWKLTEVDHSLQTKGQLIGLQVPFELTLYSKRPNRHVWPVRALRSSLLPAPPGIHIHSVRR